MSMAFRSLFAGSSSVVTVLMVIEAGATTDPPERDGVKPLAARLLTEGPHE